MTISKESMFIKTNLQPTFEIRWLVTSKSTNSGYEEVEKVLQQKFIDGDGNIFWVDVPESFG